MKKEHNPQEALNSLYTLIGKVDDLKLRTEIVMSLNDYVIVSNREVKMEGRTAEKIQSMEAMG